MTVLVDYKAGNLTSVSLALSRMGVEHRISDDPEVVRKADRIVFPGVGAAGSAMETLRTTGLADALTESVKKGVPLLGICIGCQILLDSSEEDGGTRCLGILAGEVRRFHFEDRAHPRPKVPHMGWNPVEFFRPHPVLEGISSGTHFYFVHSYYPAPTRADAILGRTEYAGTEFASILDGGNAVATQFHAEKSGEAGLRILANFAKWRP
jgi:imidazole glycerol-phosphate synthase subunit HisH